MERGRTLCLLFEELVAGCLAAGGFGCHCIVLKCFYWVSFRGVAVGSISNSEKDRKREDGMSTTSSLLYLFVPHLTSPCPQKSICPPLPLDSAR